MRHVALVAAFALATACQPASEEDGTDPMRESDADMIPVAAGEPETDAPAADPEAESVSAGEPGDALREWADALEARDWATARAMWGDDGQKSGLSPEEFASAYETYATINVELGEARVEGAAGSLYYQPDVTISGELQDGEPYRLEGPVTLRRVNDVPGASEDELRWHIESSDLKPRPPG